MPASLQSVLASQESLIEQAAAALPHQFDKCTHSLGHIRQAIYLCLACAVPRGICSACSIACHTDHEQVELFPKRDFRCDCPTEALPHVQCTLHPNPEIVNDQNAYGQNFDGRFCRCGRPYDVSTERETMIQCVACEDWYHESCLNLRERPAPREQVLPLRLTPHSSPVKSVPDQLFPPASSPTISVTTVDPIEDGTSNGLAYPGLRAGGEPHEEGNDEGEGDDGTDVSDDDLPPALLPGSAYDALICASCVRDIPAVRRISGTSGALMVVRRHEALPSISGSEEKTWKVEEWVVLGRSDGSGSKVVVDDGAEAEPATLGTKRPAPENDKERESKKPRITTSGTTSSCLAPTANPTAQAILSTPFLPSTNESGSSRTPGPSSSSSVLGAGDVFLTEGWRERWCRCDTCLPSLVARPYLTTEEETYEPPEDPDSTFSLEELGMRALQSLPRDRALDGIRAFNDMRDGLMAYLRPFAASGRVVSEADVRSFFDARREGREPEMGSGDSGAGAA